MKSFNKIKKLATDASDKTLGAVGGAASGLRTSVGGGGSGSTNQSPQSLRELFDRVDDDGSGTLDCDELNVLAAQLGMKLSSAELDAAMEEMDTDESGSVDYDKFETWWKGGHKSQGGGASLSSRFAAQFQKVGRIAEDTSKDFIVSPGAVTSSFLSSKMKGLTTGVKDLISNDHDDSMLRALFQKIDVDGSGSLDRDEVAELVSAMGIKLTEADLDAAMKEMDEDGNNEVDFDEFVTWWKTEKADDTGLRGRLLSGGRGARSKLLSFAGIKEMDVDKDAEGDDEEDTAVITAIRSVASLNGLQPSVFARLGAVDVAEQGTALSDSRKSVVEAKLVALHEAEDAIAFPTYTAATTAAIAVCCSPGSTVVCAASETDLLTLAPPSYPGARSDTAGATESRWRELPIMSTIDVVYSLNPYDGDSAADKLAALKEEQNKKVTAIILPVIARWSQQVPDLVQVVGAVRSSFPGAVIILDNTALGPLISRPLQKTASEAVDILIEGPSTAGATTDSDFGCLVLRKPVPADTVDIAEIADKLRSWRNIVGATPSTTDAALAAATLAGHQLQAHRNAAAALEVASFLTAIPCVSRVLHAGLPSHPEHGRAVQCFDSPHGSKSVLFHLPVPDLDAAKAFAASCEGFVKFAFGEQPSPPGTLFENYDKGVANAGNTPASAQGFWFGCILDGIAATECQHKLVTAFTNPAVGLVTSVGKGTATVERPRSARQQGVLRLRLSEVSAEACGWLGVALGAPPTEPPGSQTGTWFAAADGTTAATVGGGCVQMKPTQGFMFIRQLGATTPSPVIFAELLSLRVLNKDPGAVSAESMMSIGKGPDLDLCGGTLGPKLVDAYMNDGAEAPEVAVELCRFSD